jgi:GT2 family glycosyltransferase
VDNASSDGSPQLVRDEFPGARLLANDANVGFARANNQSWRLAGGRYWLLLNSDAEVREGPWTRWSTSWTPTPAPAWSRRGW